MIKTEECTPYQTSLLPGDILESLFMFPDTARTRPDTVITVPFMLYHMPVPGGSFFECSDSGCIKRLTDNEMRIGVAGQPLPPSGA